MRANDLKMRIEEMFRIKVSKSPVIVYVITKLFLFRAPYLWSCVNWSLGGKSYSRI